MKRVYSVLIAEDESEIRRALAAMVEEHPSFRVAGCAGDGKAALRMIEALRPDVLMTDIRMPYMDGLELLQALDARGIRIKTVIISGYSSFSYARTAMKYGASDYLLKPLLPAQCKQTLDLLEKALDLQAGSFSLDIALQKPSPLPQMQAEAYLLAACLGNYPFCAGDKGTDAAALRAYVKQSGLDVDSVFAGSRFGLAYLLLYAQTREEAVQTVRILFQAACRDCSATTPGVFFLLAPAGQMQTLPELAEKLRQQIRQQIQPGKMQFTLWWEHANTGTDAPPFTVDETLIRSAESLDPALCQMRLRQLLAKAYAENATCLSMLNGLKFQYISVAQHLPGAQIPQKWGEQMERCFSRYQNQEQLCRSVLALFAALFSQSESPNATARVAHEIDLYIRENYQTDITNQLLSRKFGFVPSYISKIFKAYKGVSPCSYLTDVRMEKAKRMIIEQPDQSLSVIAAAVGYTDFSYFTKVFKRSFGVTPSAYRNSIWK